jgi:uncharacterized protein (TIGR02646 family)
MGGHEVIKIDGALAPPFMGEPIVRDRREVLFDHLRLDPAARRQRRAPIDEEVFFSSPLQAAVAERCRHKCAYCESQETDHTVDHFRPYRNAKQFEDVSELDYYAWLAYEWDNLLLACRSCIRAKSDYFPTRAGRAPYLASFSEVRRLETALLIDPIHENPDRHFDFLLDGWCEPLTPKARVTVDLLGLNRADLISARHDDFLRLEMELQEWFASSQVALKIFNAGRPFTGGRLNILKRLLRNVPFKGERISGKLRQLPVLLFQKLKQEPEDGGRLSDALKSLRKEDADRTRTDPYGGRPPRVERQRTARSVSPPPPAREVGRITLTNFKGITSLTIKAKIGRDTGYGAPCMMLLGENSAGKSSILQGIALALLGGPQARRLKIKPDDYLRNRAPDRWDQLNPEPAEVQVEFLHSEGVAKFTLDADGQRIMGHEPLATLVLGYGARRYFDPRRSSRPAGAYGRVRTLFDPLATIPYPGTWLNGLIGEDFEVVARPLREIFSLSNRDDLVQDKDGRICVVVENIPVPVERLSEGYRSIFTMVADIIRELLAYFPNLESAQAVVLIDEIETHLHPRWKMQVMRSLRRALPRVQFIATTHDPLCLRGMEDGEVVVLQRDQTGQIVMLENLPSLKGMRAEQLLTSDYFGLSSTVDPQTELDLARFAERVAGSPVEEAVDLITGRLVLGESAAEQVVQEALQQFIRERDTPTGALRPTLRAEAVAAVLRALEQPDTPSATVP